NRIVLCSSAKDLNHALDFIASTNDRIKLAFLCQISQIAAECTKCWRLYVFLSRLAAFLFGLGWCEIWIELFKDLVARTFDVQFEALQYSRRDSLALAQKAQQNVFGTYVRMIESLGFLARKRQNFFDTRSIGNVPDHLGFRS